MSALQSLRTAINHVASPPPSLTNIVTIQVLRGLAAWAVVFAHFMQVFYGFQSSNILGQFFSNYGGLGVDVFFIISGFVMCLTVTSKSYTALRFLKNRILRIVPAYWAATAVFVILTLLGVIAADHDLTQWDLNNLAKSLFFIPHMHLSQIGYYPVLTVGWTLIFEMFFYTSLALCLLLFRKFALLATGILMLLLPVISDETWPLATIIDSRLLYEFVVGMILAFLYRHGLLLPANTKLALLLGMALLGVGIGYFVFSGPFERYIGSSILVAGALMFENHLRRQENIVMRFMLWLGTLSYSSYLYHPLALLTLFTAFGTPETLMGVIILLTSAVSLTLLLSQISYSLVEQRLTRLF